MKAIVFFKRHLCPDWDYLEIGPEDVEWRCCLCKYSQEPKNFEVNTFDGDNKGQGE